MCASQRPVRLYCMRKTHERLSLMRHLSNSPLDDNSVFWDAKWPIYLRAFHLALMTTILRFEMMRDVMLLSQLGLRKAAECA